MDPALRPVSPHFDDDIAQLLAIVEWDEGPRFCTEIVHAEPADLEVGMRVRPVFCNVVGQDVTMLRYETRRLRPCAERPGPSRRSHGVT